MNQAVRFRFVLVGRALKFVEGERKLKGESLPKGTGSSVRMLRRYEDVRQACADKPGVCLRGVCLRVFAWRVFACVCVACV